MYFPRGVLGTRKSTEKKQARADQKSTIAKNAVVGAETPTFEKIRLFAPPRCCVAKDGRNDWHVAGRVVTTSCFIDDAPLKRAIVPQGLRKQASAVPKAGRNTAIVKSTLVGAKVMLLCTSPPLRGRQLGGQSRRNDPVRNTLLSKSTAAL